MNQYKFLVYNKRHDSEITYTVTKTEVGWGGILNILLLMVTVVLMVRLSSTQILIRTTSTIQAALTAFSDSFGQA